MSCYISKEGLVKLPAHVLKDFPGGECDVAFVRNRRGNFEMMSFQKFLDLLRDDSDPDNAATK